MVAFELGSIINDPCPIGLVISRKKAIKKEKGQFVEAILSRCSFIRPRLDGSSNGTVEVLTVERLRPRRQAQREEYEDYN
jgi:hypothetical protein